MSYKTLVCALKWHMGDGVWCRNTLDSSRQAKCCCQLGGAMQIQPWVSRSTAAIPAWHWLSQKWCFRAQATPSCMVELGCTKPPSTDWTHIRCAELVVQISLHQNEQQTYHNIFRKACNAWWESSYPNLSLHLVSCCFITWECETDGLATLSQTMGSWGLPVPDPVPNFQKWLG